MKSQGYVPQAKFTRKQIRYLKLKRFFDICLAMVLLVVLWPVLVFAAIWIKLESKGPVIFRQRRPGYHQKIFSIYKLRSMRTELLDKDGHMLTDQ